MPFRVCPRASRARSSAAGARAGGSGLWAHGPPALPQFSDRLLCGRLSRVNTATPACFLPSRLPFSPASNSFWNCLVCREIAETEQEPPWPPTHTCHLSPHCRCLTGPVHWPSLCAAGSPVPSRGARQGRACPRGQRATGLGDQPGRAAAGPRAAFSAGPPVALAVCSPGRVRALLPVPPPRPRAGTSCPRPVLGHWAHRGGPPAEPAPARTSRREASPVSSSFGGLCSGRALGLSVLCHAPLGGLPARTPHPQPAGALGCTLPSCA